MAYFMFRIAKIHPAFPNFVSLKTISKITKL